MRPTFVLSFFLQLSLAILLTGTPAVRGEDADPSTDDADTQRRNTADRDADTSYLSRYHITAPVYGSTVTGSAIYTGPSVIQVNPWWLTNPPPDRRPRRGVVYGGIRRGRGGR